MALSSEIRRALFPISIAANKADNQVHRCNELKTEIEASGGKVVLTSAEAELALSRASAAGMIERRPGDSKFDISQKGEETMNEQQRKALHSISESLTWGRRRAIRATLRSRIWHTFSQGGISCSGRDTLGRW